jgi:hypothetical protein
LRAQGLARAAAVGANRYRNPDEDLPANFEAERAPYYAALNLPLDPDQFIEGIKAEMRTELATLDAGLPSKPMFGLARDGARAGSR